MTKAILVSIESDTLGHVLSLLNLEGRAVQRSVWMKGASPVNFGVSVPSILNMLYDL